MNEVGHCQKKLALGRVRPFQHEQKQFRAVEFISRTAELIFLFILHTLCVRQVSGQDVVQTPTQLHPRLSLMPLQLSHLQNT